MAKVIVTNGDSVEISGNDEEIAFSELDKIFGEKVRLPILHERTKFYWGEGRRFYCIIEDKPQVRTISYYHAAYRIALPYVVYLQTQDNFWVFFKSRPFVSLNDTLTPATLPNVRGGGSVCLGVFDTSDQSRAQDLIKAFWQRDFNNDYTGAWNRIVYLWRERPLNFENWQKLSKEDPEFILKIDWEGNEFAFSLDERYFPRKIRDSFAISEYVDILMRLQWERR